MNITTQSSLPTCPYCLQHFQGELKTLHYADYLLNEDNKELMYKNRKIDITRSEYLIMRVLISNKNRIVTYDQLQQIYYGRLLDSRAHVVALGKLRKKLPTNCIETVRGFGLRLKRQ